MINGLNDRLQTFLECNTYAWITDIFKFNFNGYIKKVEENKFLFIDDKLGEIWINKNDVENISFSDKKSKHN
jgi:hypothetical protein